VVSEWQAYSGWKQGKQCCQTQASFFDLSTTKDDVISIIETNTWKVEKAQQYDVEVPLFHVLHLQYVPTSLIGE
jgi:hypothetical protein